MIDARHTARLRGAIMGKNKSDVIDSHVVSHAGDVFDLDTLVLPSDSIQCRESGTAPLPIEGARWAYRGRLRSTPELYARGRSSPAATTHSAKLKS